MLLKKRKGNDNIITPDWVAKDMIDYFKPSGKILDPCKGTGVFSNMLNCEWCEINEGIDFFSYTNKVNWIVSNPPFSILRKFILHSFDVADNIVYLVPVWKIFLSYELIKRANEYGGIEEIRWYGGGAKLQFPMGNPIGAVKWKKGFKGFIKQSYTEL